LSNVTLVGLLLSVGANALSFKVAIFALVANALVGSDPIEREIDAVPDVYTGSSNIEVRVFGELGFGKKLSLTVVNFSG